MPLRCLVADDHVAVVRAVCEYLVESGYDVVARASTGPEALTKVETMKPEVAIVDLRMPGLSGVEIAQQTARVAPETKVILYTGFADKALLVEAVDAGAAGFVLKEAPLADLVRAVETVVAGGAYVDPVLAGTLGSGAATGQLSELTRRERDILRLLADGMRYEEIGRSLSISPETVRTHVKKAMDRLEASTRTQAVAVALRRSLIT